MKELTVLKAVSLADVITYSKECDSNIDGLWYYNTKGIKILIKENQEIVTPILYNNNKYIVDVTKGEQ